VDFKLGHYLLIEVQRGVSNIGLTASGLPAGVTVSFGAWSSAGTSEALFTASSTAVAGNYPISVTGASGVATGVCRFTLTVQAPSTGTTLVNLSPAYNIEALVTDGLPFSGGSLDGGLNGQSTAGKEKR